MCVVCHFSKKSSLQITTVKTNKNQTPQLVAIISSKGKEEGVWEGEGGVSDLQLKVG
jgi:hypothetical protein